MQTKGPPFQWTSYEYQIEGKKYQLLEILNKEDLFNQILQLDDNHPYIQDERIPYWTDLWPSSIGLAKYLLSHSSLVKNSTVVEIGCGMGFSGMIAQELGASVILTDYLEQAFAAADIMWQINNNPKPTCKIMDIRRPNEALTSDVIIASDVVYEKRMHKPLIRTFHVLSHAQTSIILSEPQRKYSERFFSLLENEGFLHEKTEYEILLNNKHHRVSVYRIYTANS